MEATNLKSSYAFIGFGKQFVKQIQSPPLAAAAIRRRTVHASVYEKNLDDNVCDPSIIPNNSEEYWAPHPQTGIFGPPNRGGGSQSCSGGDDKGAVSVLEQKVFFRPLEILDKPIEE